MSENDNLIEGDTVLKSQLEILRENIATYNSMAPDLQRKYHGKWAVFYRQRMIHVSDTHESAFGFVWEREEVTSSDLVHRTWPYLIIRVGDSPPRDQRLITIQMGFPDGADL